jgi:hypothetical protein
VLLAWRMPRYRAWFAALAVVLITPRFNFYDASYLLTAFAADFDRDSVRWSWRPSLAWLRTSARTTERHEKRYAPRTP